MASDGDLPFCVLTYRKGPNGNDILEAIPQSDEGHAHEVATALANTGQPTWLLTLWELEQQRYRGAVTEGQEDQQ